MKKILTIIVSIIVFLATSVKTVNATSLTNNNQYKPYKTGYTTTDVYVKEKKSVDSENKDFFVQNTLVYYNRIDDEWARLENGGYIQLNKISDEKSAWRYQIPAYSGKKSWMGYNLFGSGTNQYALQQLAETDQDGLRKVDGRYCVAIGSHFGTVIGQKFDLVLENNVVIPCVMGDQKADCHTDSSNIFTQNGCCSEFIVDQTLLNSAAKQSGDVSSVSEKWDSPVVTVIVYDENALTNNEEVK